MDISCSLAVVLFLSLRNTITQSANQVINVAISGDNNPLYNSYNIHVFPSTSRVPVEGKSSVCVMCLNYSAIILIISLAIKSDQRRDSFWTIFPYKKIARPN